MIKTVFSAIKIISVIFMLTVYTSILYFGSPLLKLVMVMILVATIVAYFMDKQRDKDINQVFKGKNLLDRYGTRINDSIYTIALPDDWDEEKVNNFREGLYLKIRFKFDERFNNDSLVTAKFIEVKDLEFRNDVRKFLNLGFKSERKSELNHFIYFQPQGQHIIGHYSVYFRGHHSKTDIAYFIITSPLHFFFWIFKWLNKEYSIVAKLSNRVSNSSFDLFDLKSFYSASNNIIMYATREFLEKKGLLTPELKSIITQNITQNYSTVIGDNNNTVQGVKVQGNLSLA